MELAAVEKLLKAAKENLATTYERKGMTDQEVLILGEKIDWLLNQYDFIMTKQKSG